MNAVREIAKRVRDRPGTRAAVGTYYCACAIRTKWRLIHPETPVELSVSLFDSLAEFICSKGSSSVGYRVDWCKSIVYSQTNSSVGVMKKKKKMEKIEVRPISVYNCSGVF